MGRSVEESTSEYLPGAVSDAATYADELPAHEAFVEQFALEKYLVTVGRFRNFVEAYPNYVPTVGSGSHEYLPGSGWSAAWKGLPATQAELVQSLHCDGEAAHNWPYLDGHTGRQ